MVLYSLSVSLTGTAGPEHQRICALYQVQEIINAKRMTETEV